jgi:hypothetical protein
MPEKTNPAEAGFVVLLLRPMDQVDISVRMLRSQLSP